MKSLIIKTRIPKNYQEVFARFDRALFFALKPPVIKLEIIRFDGCKTGDEVHLQLTPFPFIHQSWVSKITEHGANDRECYFVDEGKVLPKPFKFWRHTHKVRKISENECEIIDDIMYTSQNSLIDEVLYLSLHAMFSLRISAYKKYFRS